MLDHTPRAPATPGTRWPEVRTPRAQVDADGVTWQHGSWPWPEIDRFAAVPGRAGGLDVFVAHRDGRCVALGIGAGGRPDEASLRQLVADLNRTAGQRRRPSELEWPLRFSGDRTVRRWTTAGVGVGLALLGSSLAVLAGTRSDPGFEVAVVGIAVALVASLQPLLWEGLSVVTVTPEHLERRTLGVVRRWPLDAVAAVQSWPGPERRRSAAHLVDGRVVVLPGRDPDYRIPALDAHVRSLRGARGRPPRGAQRWG